MSVNVQQNGKLVPVAGNGGNPADIEALKAQLAEMKTKIAEMEEVLGNKANTNTSNTFRAKQVITPSPGADPTVASGLYIESNPSNGAPAGIGFGLTGIGTGTIFYDSDHTFNWRDNNTGNNYKILDSRDEISLANRTATSSNPYFTFSSYGDAGTITGLNGVKTGNLYIETLRFNHTAQIAANGITVAGKINPISCYLLCTHCDRGVIYLRNNIIYYQNSNEVRAAGDHVDFNLIFLI